MAVESVGDVTTSDVPNFDYAISPTCSKQEGCAVNGRSDNWRLMRLKCALKSGCDRRRVIDLGQGVYSHRQGARTYYQMSGRWRETETSHWLTITLDARDRKSTRLNSSHLGIS